MYNKIMNVIAVMSIVAFIAGLFLVVWLGAIGLKIIMTAMIVFFVAYTTDMLVAQYKKIKEKEERKHEKRRYF